MDKKEILKELIAKAQEDLTKAQKSYQVTQTMVQKGDLKPDGKYDTRATEANYLADGQRQRITDLENEMLLLEDIPTRKLTNKDDIGIGALVDIEFNGQIRAYYISPTAGGTLLSINGQAILVISVFSPIGREAMNLNIGDNFEVEINNSQREYKIINIR
jgi:transcription elongation GreA/GreB family factor